MFSDLRKTCGAGVYSFNHGTNQVIVMATDQAVVKKSTLLADMHFKNLRQKMLLKMRTEEVARKLEVS